MNLAGDFDFTKNARFEPTRPGPGPVPSAVPGHAPARAAAPARAPAIGAALSVQELEAQLRQQAISGPQFIQPLNPPNYTIRGNPPMPMLEAFPGRPLMPMYDSFYGRPPVHEPFGFNARPPMSMQELEFAMRQEAMQKMQPQGHQGQHQPQMLPQGYGNMPFQRPPPMGFQMGPPQTRPPSGTIRQFIPVSENRENSNLTSPAVVAQGDFPTFEGQKTRQPSNSKQNESKTFNASNGPSNIEKNSTGKSNEPKILLKKRSDVEPKITENKVAKKELDTTDFPALGGPVETKETRQKITGNGSYKSTNQQQRNQARLEQSAQLMGMPETESDQQEFMDSDNERVIERVVDEENLRREDRYRKLMTDRENHLIAKIQISHLVTADPYSDDFYYQVFTALQGDEGSPQENGVKTKSNKRFGKGNSYNLSNYLQKELQKSIDRGKIKPREGTVSLEGSLGKISTTSVRAPKKTIQVPLAAEKSIQPMAVISPKEILRNIENAYTAVLHLEQLSRRHPTDVTQSEKREADREHWLNVLWPCLYPSNNVPLDVPHPCVSFLTYAKGMTIMPRLLGFLAPDNILTFYLTVFTRLESLPMMDVRTGTISENVETFMATVIPTLVSLLGEASLSVINRLSRALIERHNLVWMAKSRIGLSILTIILSRSEILKQAITPPTQEELTLWGDIYVFLFESLTGHFASLFPNSDGKGLEDVYVWQFLSALAVGSSSVHYQLTLVSEVRENAISTSKMGDPKSLDNVNLFLTALGLQIDAAQLASTL